MKANLICEHDRCDCTLEDDYVTDNGKRYCSTACARGEGCDHRGCKCASTSTKSGKEDRVDPMQGEGNRAADRRYREGVQETMAEIDDQERAEKARALHGTTKSEAREAERRAGSRARD